MASKWINIPGMMKWANSPYGGLFTVDPKYDNFVISWYPTPEGWEVFKKSGIQIKSYSDEDGDYLRLKRPASKIIKGELVKFSRPKVFFEEGIEPTKDIGNKSEGIANICVYDTQKGPGHRLEAVTVTNLVEFTRSEGGGPANNLKELIEDAEESDEVGDADSDPVGHDKAELNDEIPFGKGDTKPAAAKPTTRSSSSGTKASPFRRSA